MKTFSDKPGIATELHREHGDAYHARPHCLKEELRTLTEAEIAYVAGGPEGEVGAGVTPG